MAVPPERADRVRGSAYARDAAANTSREAGINAIVRPPIVFGRFASGRRPDGRPSVGGLTIRQAARRASILDPYQAKVDALLVKSPNLSAMRIREEIAGGPEGYTGSVPDAPMSDCCGAPANEQRA